MRCVASFFIISSRPVTIIQTSGPVAAPSLHTLGLRRFAPSDLDIPVSQVASAQPRPSLSPECSLRSPRTRAISTAAVSLPSAQRYSRAWSASHTSSGATAPSSASTRRHTVVRALVWTHLPIGELLIANPAKATGDTVARWRGGQVFCCKRHAAPGAWQRRGAICAARRSRCHPCATGQKTISLLGLARLPQSFISRAL